MCELLCWFCFFIIILVGLWSGLVTFLARFAYLLGFIMIHFDESGWTINIQVKTQTFTKKAYYKRISKTNILHLIFNVFVHLRWYVLSEQSCHAANEQCHAFLTFTEYLSCICLHKWLRFPKKVINPVENIEYEECYGKQDPGNLVNNPGTMKSSHLFATWEYWPLELLLELALKKMQNMQIHNLYSKCYNS